LIFENYGQKVGPTNTLLVPNLKVGGPVSPVPTVVAPMTLTLTDRQTHTRKDTEKKATETDVCFI